MISAIYLSHQSSVYSGASVYTSVFLPFFFRDAESEEGVFGRPCLDTNLGRKRC